MAKKMEYDLKEKQDLVRDALTRMDTVHQHWRILEALYRTGSRQELDATTVAGILPFAVPGTFLRAVNMLLPHLTLIINSVAARDPKFVIVPVGGDPEVVERNGVTAKAVLEYFWKRSDATAVLRDMTQDMVNIGNAFGKVGWSYSETTRDRTNEEMITSTTNAFAQVDLQMMEGQTELDEQTLSDVLDAVSLTEQMVEVDEPYVEYVSPYDIFVPADARRLNNVRWVCQRIRLPKDEIEKNENFNKKAVENLKPDTAFMSADAISRNLQLSETLPQSFAYVTLYEFYDMRNRTLCVFQLDNELPLYEGEIPYAHRYPPFVHIRNFSDGGSSFWGFGDIENVAGIQLMVNETIVAQVNNMKRAGTKYFINKKALTPEITKALGEAKSDQVIPIDLPNNVNMSEVVVPIHRAPTPAEFYTMENKLQDYVQRILGVSDLQSGAISDASRVAATGVAAAEGATTVRSMEKMVNVERAAREIGTRMLALCQQFLAENKAIRIAGPNAPEWLKVSVEDIDGEFSVDVEGGSTQAINPSTKARAGMEQLTQIVPVLVQLNYDPTNLLRTSLTSMGLNADHILVKMPPAPVPGQPPVPGQGADPLAAGMPGDMGPISPELNDPMMQALSDLGGPPVPAGSDGQPL